MQARWSAYAGASMVLAGGVVVKALAQRPNFYSAAVYLSQSSANLMIMTNMLFVVACTVLLGLQKLLYGPLRPIEIEQLYEKAWFAVTETCLAMTIFRGEIGSRFMVMFFALLAGKVWAWIGEGRVEILEQQPPRDPKLFHTRLALSLGLSVVFDLSVLEYIIKEVMRMPKPDMMVMFGFEFAILSIISLSTASRYAINLVEIGIIRKQKTQRVEDIKRERREAAVRQVLSRALAAHSDRSTENTIEQPDSSASEPPSLTAEAADAARTAGEQPVEEAEIEVEGWEGKGRWVFYLDLATDFLKLVVYLSFFFILLAFYGLPIHILRDVFLTCRSFIKRITDFIKYRNATKDMNERYPDATEQDFGRDDVCIICREEMRPYEAPANNQPPNPVAERMRPKKLPCGHVLHFSCLRSWLERQQICPTCRTSVIPVNQNTGHNAGDAQGAGEQQQPQAPPARGRGGVLRLGPLRIAVGAVRGNNIVGDLQQRLRDGEGQPAAAEANNNNNNAPQQYGFGIRWDGMRRRERRDHRDHRDHRHRSIQDQLQSLERQIQQEANSLTASMAELQILRNMEAQLAMLRRQRQATAGIQSPVAPVPSNGSVNTTQLQAQLVGNAGARLSAGHPNLPVGLTLPDGWTMTPLSPAPAFQAQPGGGAIPFMPNPAFATQFRGPTGPTHLPASSNMRQDTINVNNIPTEATSSQQNQMSHQPPQSNSATNGTTTLNATQSQTVADAMPAITNSVQTPDQGETPVRSQATSSSTTSQDSNTTAVQSTSSPDSALPLARSPTHGEASATPLLPFWGSNTAESNGEISNTENDEHTQVSAAEASGPSEKRRNPTVEDLVEDPD